jgi:exopolysaccharide biosynthesis polyprenyl glycosylphosphotransferase
MPYLGGAAILMSVILGVVVSIYMLPEVAGPVPRRYYFLGITSIAIALVGLYDDLKNLRFSTKFYFQIMAALIVIYGGLHFSTIYIPYIGDVYLGWGGYLFTLLWIIFITNAINLLDGLDGLAAGVTSIIYCTFAIIALHSGRTLVALINLLLVAANLGFLKYNRYPAKIFMGDAGSLFLGFATAIISLEIGRIGDSNHLNIILPLTVMAMPVLDTSIAFFRRASKRMHPFKADKEHIHHRLMSIGFSHKNAVKVIYCTSICASLMGLAFIYLDREGVVTVLFCGLILAMMLIRRLGYFEIEKNLIVVSNGNGNCNGQGNGNGNGNGLLNGNGHKQQNFIPFDTAHFIQAFLFFLIDVIACVVSFLLVYFYEIRVLLPAEAALPTYDLILWMVWAVLYWTIILGLNNLYRIEWDTSRLDEVVQVFKTVFFGTVVLFFVSFEIKFPFIISRRVFIPYGILLTIMLSTGRVLLITILKAKEALEFRKRPTIIVGISKAALNVVRKINSLPVLKFQLIGFVDDKNMTPAGEMIQNLPVLGTYDDLPKILKKYKIKEVIIAVDETDVNKVMDLIAFFSQYNVSIKLVPDFYNVMTGFKTSHIYGISLIKFFDSNMKTWEWVLKRLMDIVISLFVLIAFAPVWLILAVIIKLDSPGPVFYRQKRVGKNRQEFDLIKFRSMVKDAEELTGPKWAEKDDPRVTRFGRFLRKYGLDEIPQFFNVLIGDMSIVGPRPERPFFVNELEHSIQFYSRRLIVKPGITGWAQIKYKYDETIDDVREKLRYDLYYIENMSILLDLKIIVQTLLVGLRRKHRVAYV